MLVKSYTGTTLSTCFDQAGVSVRTISDQKAVDDSRCLLKAEVEEEVCSLQQTGKYPGVNIFLSERIKH
ncbi:hypothetical protein DPMN_019233 [Dreissena polymorpha]|uniref:Uncharacterized protein n=1 Tax=Dreissena polymorpha TaxID=45954 RepID=A0A9D4NI25_DREPO|nr:hypothetical protein DPMN_019233 [Dreissena polymorpha]